MKDCRSCFQVNRVVLLSTNTKSANCTLFVIELKIIVFPDLQLKLSLTFKFNFSNE